jgi:photosynthetic reaction center cytochrome c subunit
MQTGLACRWIGLLIICVSALMAGCERPPVQSVQIGYRGTGMEQTLNPRTLQAQAPNNAVPAIAPPARVRVGGPKAGTTYQNIKVLNELSLAEFGRTMDAMTQWVSPQEGCLYCHVEGNFADESKYTKVVARRMLQMVQNVNTSWKPHVGETGVTCYTCHRGKPLPSQIWFRQPPERGHDVMGDRAGQNTPARSVGLSSLPFDPLTPYLLDEVSAKPIRVAGNTALAGGNRSSVKQAEFTYGLMMHFSQSLGVNCTYCHNTRAFASWPESTPQRSTAWHGIRMARDINGNYLEGLSATFPEIPLGRLGPTKDAAKVSCATCHQGANKPLYGAQMAKHYPAMSVRAPAPAASAATTAAESTPAAAAAASAPTT